MYKKQAVDRDYIDLTKMGYKNVLNEPTKSFNPANEVCKAVRSGREIARTLPPLSSAKGIGLPI